MIESEYPILELARRLNIPRSVMVNAVASGALETTCKFDKVGSRQRARHFATEANALRLLKAYLDGEDERQAHIEQSETGRKWARPVDVYSHEARSKLEDLLLLRELEPYGVTAGDVF